jgi:hypothetical protein
MLKETFSAGKNILFSGFLRMVVPQGKGIFYLKGVRFMFVWVKEGVTLL